jgi:hypothetical protein
MIDIESAALHFRAALAQGVKHRAEKDRYDCLFQHPVYLRIKTNKGPVRPGDA